MPVDRRRRQLVLAPEVVAELERRCRCGTTAQRDVFRARVILETAEDRSAAQVAARLETRKATVAHWVRRFRAMGLGGLEDAPRSGRPKLFDEQVRLEVAALAVDDPKARAHQRNRWTVRALAAELASRGRAAPKRSTVWTMLRGAGIRTNRSEFWLFSKDPDFESKVNAIAPLLAPPPADELVISIDEKTSIQALSRLHEGAPPAPNRARRVEHGYVRHGTVDLIAGYVPSTGEVFGLVTEAHTHLEFGFFLTRLLERFPGKLVLLMDNLSVHKHAAIKRYLAALRGRVRVLFTPTHASWLNPIESWFSILSRHVLRGGSFGSKEALVDRLYDYLERWNEYEKKPLRWKFRGFPTSRHAPKASAPVAAVAPAQ